MKRLNIVLFILSVVLFFIPHASATNANVNEDAPNVIFIFPDQYRLFSLGFWSQPGQAKHLPGKPDPVRTPALDKLANEGIVFNRAVSNFPLCSPYRGMLLSGMYPDHNGLTANCRRDRQVTLRRDVQCVTDVFSQAGYDVSYFGKCHWLRTDPVFDVKGNYVGSQQAPGGHYMNDYDTYIPPGPDRHSIDYFFQMIKDVHYDSRTYSNDPGAIEGLADGQQYRPKRFSCEVEAEKINDYLSNTRSQRDTDKPFFMIWSLNPPHNPWDEPNTYMQFYPEYAKMGEDVHARKNADHQAGDYAPYYFANVTAVDYFIGKVLDHLDSLGLAENTIVVFSSDHGEMLGSHSKQGKNVPEAESYSIPFIVKWHEKLAHRVEDLIMSVPDVMPTLLGLTGLADKIPNTVQGNDYSALLFEPETKKVIRPQAALYHGYHARGIYNGQYTFIVNEKDGQFTDAFCYDNKNDPYQLTKLTVDQLAPETVKGLKTELWRLLEETNDFWYQQGTCRSFLLK